MERPLFIPVILGTARQGRRSEHAARLVFEQTKKRTDIGDGADRRVQGSYETRRRR